MSVRACLRSPNSSRITRLLLVAWWRIFAVSLSSTKNVDCPARIRSDAPTLVKILSSGVRCASSAGTKQPTCSFHGETMERLRGLLLCFILPGNM